jgi:hypothetical protein
MSFYDYSTNLAETLRGSVSVLEDMFGTPLDQAFHTMFGGVGGTGGSIGGPFVPPPQATNRVPPASERVLRNLPVVCVRPEDLIDRANRECCICLEAINVNDRVLRLPCAHHFHGPCIRDWVRPKTHRKLENIRQEGHSLTCAFFGIIIVAICYSF